MSRSRRRVLTAAAIVSCLGVIVAVVVILTRGGGSDRVTARDATTTSDTTTASRVRTTSDAPTTPDAPTTTDTTPPSGGWRFLPENESGNGFPAPLTGLPVPDPDTLTRPLLAVKIDNLDLPRETARPQAGLAFADVVIEEVVEGGITRFVALVHSTDSPEMGPIRSARTTDVHLLPAFGRPLFAYSGGNSRVLAAVRAAPSIIDRGGEWAPAYARDQRRRAPHNLYMRPWEIWARPGSAAPPRVLAEFRPPGQRSTTGQQVTGVDISHRGAASTPVSWRWLPEHRRWLRVQGGTVHLDGAGYAIGPRNVIVAFTDYTRSPADRRSPEAQTTGVGAAWILTDGKLITGRWERRSEQEPFAFLDGSGRPVPLSAGRTWIELVAAGHAHVVR